MSAGKTTLTSITPGAIINIFDLNSLYERISVVASDNMEVNLVKRQMTTVTFKINDESKIDEIRVIGMLGQLLELDKGFSSEIQLPLGEILYNSYTSGNSNFCYEVNEYNQVLRSVEIAENLVIEDTVHSFKNKNDVLITFNPDYIGD